MIGWNQETMMALGLFSSAGYTFWRARVELSAGAEGLAWFGLCGVAAVVGARLAWAAEVVRVRGWGALDVAQVVHPSAGGLASAGALAGAALMICLAWALVWRHEQDTPSQAPRRERAADVQTGQVASADPGASDTGPQRRASVAGRWLGVLVPAGALGLGLARMGCLARGCDFGRPTDLPIAVFYTTEDAPAWVWWQAQGWVGAETPPLHPFPAYLSLGTLALVLLATVRYPSGGVRRAWLVALGYVLVRLASEWTRQPLLTSGSPLRGASLYDASWTARWSVHHTHASVALVALLALAWWTRRTRRA